MSLLELKGPVMLDIPSDPAALFMVRALVSKLAERLEFSAEESQALVLAVDEACTNVIRHAYKNCMDQRIILSFIVNLERFEVQIRDFGLSADPSTFQSRKLDDVRPGGLGIHFIRSAVDSVEYKIQAEGGTLLKMIKFRPKRENG